MAGLVDKQGFGVGLAPTNRVRIPYSYDIYDQDGNNIGYLDDISPTSTRAVDGIRHINSADAGRVIEGVPRPSDDTISVTGFAIYNEAVDKRGTLLNRLGGDSTAAFKHINEQKIPFTIVITCHHPGNPDYSQENHETKYIGCYLTRYNAPLRQADSSMSETADIFVSWVE